MEIFSACPFSVATLSWEPAPGRRSVCVSVKATFTLVHGGIATIATLQEPLAIDAREGDAGELAPFKPRADVLLTGHVHAPRGAAADTLIARARVGPWRKSLNVTGDRAWVPSFDGLRPSVAVPFRRMPLTYDRAVRAGENAGGIDIIAQGAELGKALPNIAAIADQGTETPGFGPLPLSWRARRYGLADAALLWASRVALAPGPPPAGFDFRVFNAAPIEQQLDEIPVGVDIALENLHPDHPRLETRLPALRIKLFRQAPRGDRVTETPVRGDTIVIDADRGLCCVTWRGAVPIEGGDEASIGRLVIAAEVDGERIGPEHADRLLAQLSPAVTYVEAGPAFGLAPKVAAHTPARSAATAHTASYPPPAAPAPSPHPRRTQPPAMPQRPITHAPLAPTGRPPSDAPRGTLIPTATPAPMAPQAPPNAGLMRQPTVTGALPFRPAPTGRIGGDPQTPGPAGFEATPAMASRESYPPPPPPAHALSPHPPPGTLPPAPPPVMEAPVPSPPHRAGPTPPMMAAPVLPMEPPSPAKSWSPDEDERTPPRGFAIAGERTAKGTIVPPPSARPAPPEPGLVECTPSGTIRPPAADVSAIGEPPRAPAPPERVERTPSGTLRPPPADLSPASVGYPPVSHFAGRPTPTPPAAVIASLGLPFVATGVTGPTGDAASPPELPFGLALWCAVKVEAWAGAAPLAEILGRRGIEESTFRAFEREQSNAIAREAADGRTDRALTVVEALHAARGAV